MEAITRRRFVKTGAVAAGTVAVGAIGAKATTRSLEVEHPAMEMGDGMSKVLVVYGTKSGCTTGVAEKIGQTLADAGAAVDVVPVESAGDPSGYDAVVVGSGVRAGQWHAVVKSWVEGNTGALKQMPVAFYTCCLTMAGGPEKADEARAYTDPLLEATGIEPLDIGLFAGWFEPKQFSFAERTILKLMKAPEGDLRDWPAIQAWAEKTAPQLGVAA